MKLIDGQSFSLKTDERSIRLDIFLTERLKQFSRSRIQSLIKAGNVLVDGEMITKASMMTTLGQVVTVNIPPSEPVDLIPEKIPLKIVFENNDLVIIDKPAGMVVHPAAGHMTGTLVHAMLAHAPEMEGISGEQRPGIVHRLDRDTSGLIIIAKNDRAHQWLQDQFKQRHVRKVYIALLDGHPPTPEGRVEAAIGRDTGHRKQMAIVSEEKGRQAESEYKTLEVFPQHTLVEVHPLTGRTHQIRLHMKLIGCPIVGDKVYGHRSPSLPLERQFLHAARLTIILPGEVEARTFEAPLPPDLQEVIENLHQRK